MDIVVLSVFLIVYLGMFLGELPGLALDRTGVALLGAIVILAFGRLETSHLCEAVDFPTLALLLGLMIVSAQFRLSGFYTWLVRRLTAWNEPPAMLLGVIIFAAAGLSAVLANDIVCLAMTPVTIECCTRRKLDPVPFLLGLACGANIGSAATLIGNPQNMLIGQVLRVSFAGYLQLAALPALLGTVVAWLIIWWASRGKWHRDLATVEVMTPLFNPWQTAKSLLVTVVLMVLFLVSSWPHDVIALAAGGVVLCSRRMHSRHMLGLVDWQLLVLFIGLFVVTHAMQTSGNLAAIMQSIAELGIRVEHPVCLFGVTVVLSNLVSNVPAVMLLLPFATEPLAGPILALASTLAGNLLVVGSIANIIVIDQARLLRIEISWRDHARVGIPVTVATLALAAGWLWILSGS